MNEHQRRVFGSIIEQIDASAEGAISIGPLAAPGLLDAADLGRPDLIEQFWEHVGPIETARALEAEGVPVDAEGQRGLKTAVMSLRTGASQVLEME